MCAGDSEEAFGHYKQVLCWYILTQPELIPN